MKGPAASTGTPWMRWVGESRVGYESGNIEIVDGDPTPAVVVDTGG